MMRHRRLRRLQQSQLLQRRLMILVRAALVAMMAVVKIVDHPIVAAAMAARIVVTEVMARLLGRMGNWFQKANQGPDNQLSTRWLPIAFLIRRSFPRTLRKK